MAVDAGRGGQSLTIKLDAATFEALQRSAAALDREPAVVVAGWVRERLAHEAERAKGRARPQRPGE